MKSNLKLISILTILLGTITICLAILVFLNYIDIDIMMIFLGFTQLFSGVNQICLERQINSKGKTKWNKMVGIFSIVLGIVIIISMVIKFIFK